MFSRLASLWRNLRHKSRTEQELDEELRSFVDLLESENISAGMTPREARRQAMLHLGGMDSVKEEVRDVRIGFLFDQLAQDVRQSCRTMTRTAGFTALAVVMVALGIGATTLIFSVFDSVLLRPLPFREPERIVQVFETRMSKGWDRNSFTHANFQDLRSMNRSFEELAAARGGDANMTGSGDPEHVSLNFVSAGFLRVLGVVPLHGRDFTYKEDQPGSNQNLVLIENRFWKTRFGADPGVVGRTLRLDNKAYTVIGVLPPGEPWLDGANLFVLLPYDSGANRGSFELGVIGRLKRGVSIEAANRDLKGVAFSLARDFPLPNEGMGFFLEPSSAWIATRQVRQAMYVLMGAVGFLLLIACVNLANLLLARATGRLKEIAIRSAMGASRARIARLVLTESMLVCGAGSVVGLLLAHSGIAALKAAELTDLPRMSGAAINGRALAFTIAAAILTGILAALAPAFQTPVANVREALHEGGRNFAGSRVQVRLRSVLVSAEVALSIVLLVGAGLLIRSFMRLVNVDPGFESENRMVFSVNVPDGYTPERMEQLLRTYLGRVSSSSRFRSVAAVHMRPVTGGNTGMGIGVAGKPSTPGEAVPWAGWRLITSDYFRVMGVPLVAGRNFTEADRDFRQPRTVILSKRLAELLFDKENPIGKRVLLWKGQGGGPAEVIGVAGNMRERGLDSNPTLAVYFPYFGWAWRPIEFVVHTAGDPVQSLPLLRSMLAEVDPNLPLSAPQTFESLVGRSVAPKRFGTLLLSMFGGLALLLALTGVYGVLAYSVSKRTPEFGIRLALGATHASIMRLTFSQGMRPVIAGIAAGVCGALALSSFISSMLYGVGTLDAVTYAAVVLLVVVAALLSCSVPSWKATRVDPAVALRAE